jgi:hypothetical protein
MYQKMADTLMLGVTPSLYRLDYLIRPTITSLVNVDCKTVVFFTLVITNRRDS